MGIQDRIKDIELEVSRTQKNKATEYHLGLLKSRLVKLRTQLIEGEKVAKVMRTREHGGKEGRKTYLL